MSDLPDPANPSTTPLRDAVLQTFREEYEAGRLPEEIQNAIKETRDRFVEATKENADGLREDAREFAADYIDAVRSGVQHIVDQHPDMAIADISPSAAEAVEVLGDMAHREIDLQGIVDDFVRDAARDIFDYSRDLVDIRLDANDDGVYTTSVVDAQRELNTLEAQFESTLDARAEIYAQAHDNVDAILDAAADDPAAFNADVAHERHLTNPVNAVEVDTTVTGETDEA